MFWDSVALQATLEEDVAGALRLASRSCCFPHGGLEAQLAVSPRDSRARGCAVYKHHPGVPRVRGCHTARPSSLHAACETPWFSPRWKHLRLLIAIMAKGRAAVGQWSLLVCAALLSLHLSNTQARGLEQGCLCWVKNRNFIARQSSSAGER